MPIVLPYSRVENDVKVYCVALGISFPGNQLDVIDIWNMRARAKGERIVRPAGRLRPTRKGATPRKLNTATIGLTRKERGHHYAHCKKCQRKYPDFVQTVVVQ